MLSRSFSFDVAAISVAHAFVLETTHKCEYPNGRGQYGLIYVAEGTAEYRFRTGERLSVSAGDLLLLAPRAAYSVRIHTTFRHYTVNFSAHEETTAFPSDECYFLIRPDNAEPYRQAVKELVRLWETRAAGYEMRCTGELYLLLAALAAEIGEREAECDAMRRLRPARSAIEKGYLTGISTERLAWLCNMSVTHFRREFRRVYGETALAYRDRLRLSYAKEYLCSGYYTVTEVAEKCGFEDASYFIRFFKKHTGVSPRTYMVKG